MATVFVPDSVVVTLTCPTKIPTGAPMVISKKYFEITAHPKWPSQQNTLIFCFFISPFFSSICRRNFDKTVARKSSVPSRVRLVKKGDASYN